MNWIFKNLNLETVTEKEIKKENSNLKKEISKLEEKLQKLDFLKKSVQEFQTLRIYCSEILSKSKCNFLSCMICFF